MTDIFNNKVFIVKDTVTNNSILVIEENILDNYKTLGCLGELKLVEEKVHSSWGFGIDKDSRLATALISAGLHPADYRSRVLGESPSEDCLNRVRYLLGVGEHSDNKKEFTFM